MFGLVVGFAKWMHKPTANAQEKTIPSLEVPGGKCFRLFGLYEEVQADPMVILVSLSERVLKAPFSIGGTAQDASRKACAELEDGAQSRNFPMLTKYLSRLHLLKQLVSHCRGPDGSVS